MREDFVETAAAAAVGHVFMSAAGVAVLDYPVEFRQGPGRGGDEQRRVRRCRRQFHFFVDHFHAAFAGGLVREQHRLVGVVNPVGIVEHGVGETAFLFGHEPEELRIAGGLRIGIGFLHGLGLIHMRRHQELFVFRRNAPDQFHPADFRLAVDGPFEFDQPVEFHGGGILDHRLTDLAGAGEGDRAVGPGGFPGGPGRFISVDQQPDALLEQRLAVTEDLFGQGAFAELVGAVPDRDGPSIELEIFFPEGGHFIFIAVTVADPGEIGTIDGDGNFFLADPGFERVFADLVDAGKQPHFHRLGEGPAAGLFRAVRRGERISCLELTGAEQFLIGIGQGGKIEFGFKPVDLVQFLFLVAGVHTVQRHGKSLRLGAGAVLEQTQILVADLQIGQRTAVNGEVVDADAPDVLVFIERALDADERFFIVDRFDVGCHGDFAGEGSLFDLFPVEIDLETFVVPGGGDLVPFAFADLFAGNGDTSV